MTSTLKQISVAVAFGALCTAAMTAATMLAL